MKIVVITGSPHKNGTSAQLAAEFIKGAAEAGNEIYRFDAAFSQVHPCIGCDHCECGKRECVFKDEELKLYPQLIGADLVAFVSPLYYRGLSAQIKAVIDRFHGVDDLIRGGKKAVLLISAADSAPWVTDGVTATYETDLKYLKWQDCGRVLATGCYKPEDLLKTDFRRQAYLLGKSIK